MTTIYVYTGEIAAERNNSWPASQAIGLAYVNQRRGRLATTFAYDPDYLAHPSSCAIDPELPLQAGNWPVLHELPGALMDSTPDRWGRNLINKRYPGKKLNSLDYLLGVSDVTRQGALRFKTEKEGAYQYPDARVPKLVALPELLSAAESIDSPRKGSEAIKFLLEAGSGSLGGARPKAVIDKNGELYLAKFPHNNDQEDVVTAEYQALQGAKKKGMDVPDCELVKVADKKVLLTKRFDRRVNAGETERLLYISAMTALGAIDGEQRDYLEIIDFITKHGSRPKQDIAELLRRIRYTIEINNTDDHLRNHGFLYEKGGWCLSPLFDVNPNNNKRESRQTSLGGHTDSAGSMQVLEQLESQY
ncbi:MAG: type II toxin-antitoxin system HipA family toxin [Coriobacteriia bacterium]|nr:type II toxin-antitoxin system HipA family toxin [Coriobacteriia bacterium]MCL2749744.1 type II toxin-antitoxin system HipA family toxin [Coriobacteriia bacterium]